VQFNMHVTPSLRNRWKHWAAVNGPTSNGDGAKSDGRVTILVFPMIFPRDVSWRSRTSNSYESEIGFKTLSPRKPLKEKGLLKPRRLAQSSAACRSIRLLSCSSVCQHETLSFTSSLSLSPWGVKEVTDTAAGGTAAAVVRVHADYTAESAPARLKQLGKAGVYSHIRKRNMTEEEVAELMTKRFSFINVWRNIVETPVEVSPLAVADAISTPEADRFLYELIFPNRIGLNYSLKHSDKHKWFYYPKMVKDECLLFKVYDKKEDGPRFTFHTAFQDPLTPEDAPARHSIETRTIAFFDCPVDDNTLDSSAKEGTPHE